MAAAGAGLCIWGGWLTRTRSHPSTLWMKQGCNSISSNAVTNGWRLLSLPPARGEIGGREFPGVTWKRSTRVSNVFRARAPAAHSTNIRLSVGEDMTSMSVRGARDFPDMGFGVIDPWKAA